MVSMQLLKKRKEEKVRLDHRGKVNLLGGILALFVQQLI